MNDGILGQVTLSEAKLTDELNRMWSQSELLLSAASTLQDRILHVYQAAGLEEPTTRVRLPRRGTSPPIPPRWTPGAPLRKGE